PPLLDALVGIVRWRRIDFLAGFVLFTIALAVGLVALGGDPRLYLIRESFITAGVGLAFVLSNPLLRPLGFFFARYFMAGNDQARLAWVNDRWQRSASFRTPSASATSCGGWASYSRPGCGRISCSP